MSVEDLTKQINQAKARISELRTVVIPHAYAVSASAASSTSLLSATEAEVSEFHEQYNDVRSAERELKELTETVGKLVKKRARLRGYRPPARHSK